MGELALCYLIYLYLLVIFVSLRVFIFLIVYGVNVCMIGDASSVDILWFGLL